MRTTRRSFLIGGLKVTAALPLWPGLARGLGSACAEGERALVIVQLTGGNDGLNTLVPHRQDAYFRARPAIGLPRGELHRLDDDHGLHPSMAKLAALFTEGRAAAVHGVGYPEPDRSHFRSMEIWQTASDADEYKSSGWVGRYFDNECEGRPQALAGVYLGNDLPQAFHGDKGMGVAFQSPENFGYVSGVKGNDMRSFKEMNRSGVASGNAALDFLRHVTDNAIATSDHLHKIAREQINTVQYPNDAFAQSLASIARMIGGGLGTRIYYTAISGFDTHANQVGPHNNLMNRYQSAVGAFQRDLTRMGESRRVVTMTFSEFGRRVAENANVGTDHGTAAPMFLMGDPVKAGLHGKRPSLTDLDRGGDMKFTTDFRSVYGSVLRQWFGADPKPTLDGEFAELPLIAKA
jgi:uncharacterized protein (DUF1501 family)